jgi:heptosyltransferase-2
MKLLIIKLGAAGDVVRTTTLLHAFANAEIDWLTLPRNAPLLSGTQARVLTDAAQTRSAGTYDLVLSLEEDAATVHGAFAALRCRQVIGTYPADTGLQYTPECAEWYDMSLISRLGAQAANALKWQNRRSYQEIMFGSIGWPFADQPYVLPPALPGALHGDIAIVDRVGHRWPNKRWAFAGQLAERLRDAGSVNILPWRRSMLEHLADVRNHRVVVTPDSLPLHFGIGLERETIGLFLCTSPWEIHPSARLTRLVSAHLERFFYATAEQPEAKRALTCDQVEAATRAALHRTSQREPPVDHRPAFGEIA